MKENKKITKRSFLKKITAFSMASMVTPRILFGKNKMNSKSASLIERLGYKPDSRLIIITCDEFGECHAANIGIIKAHKAGLMTSATLMMPSPWVMEAVEYIRSNPKVDVGVHLTLTLPIHTGKGVGRRIRPICSRSEVPGLYTPEGYIWPNGREMWKHASPEEVKRECRAQIEKALSLGIDITHLDPHDGVISANIPGFGKLYGELGEEFALPLRMPPSQQQLEALGYPTLRPEISKKGVLMSDHGMGLGGIKIFRRRIHELPPGSVTDIWIHPAVECDELKACSGDWWKERVEEFQLFTEDSEKIRSIIEEEHIILIGWREIKNLQKSDS